MASQVTHIVYGKKIFDRSGLIDWPKFAVGTVFPDIRYIAKIDRSLLHTHGTSEDQIPRDNAFASGHYVHCLVDEKREAYVKSKGVYSILPRGLKHVPTALKLVEDEFTYPLYPNWSEIINYLDIIYDEEISHGIDRQTILKWHQYFQNYMKQIPTEDQWKETPLFLGFDQTVADELMKSIVAVKQTPAVLKIIKDTYQNI